MLNRHVRSVLRLQLLFTLVGAAGCIFWGGLVVLSWLLGGGIALAGGLLYAKVAYARAHVPAPMVMRAHFLAEFIKMGTALLLFMVVFLFFKQVSVLAFFGGYLAAVSAYWIGLLVNFGEKQ